MMRKSKRLTALVFAVAFGAAPVQAEDKYTSAEFLSSGSVKSQDAYIQNAVTMTGVVATQVRPEVAACIDKWYAYSDGSNEKRNKEIREVMREYPEYHPAGVILAVIQQACGKIGGDG